MDVIKLIKKIDLNFDMNKYDNTIFNEKTIKLFGLETLIKYIEYLDKELISVALSNPNRFELIYNDNIILFCNNINIVPKELFFNNLLSDDMLKTLNIYEIQKDKNPKKFYEFLIKNNCRTDSDFNLIHFYKNNRNFIDQLDLDNKQNLDKLNLYYKLFITLENYQIKYKLEKIVELDNINIIIRYIVENFILNNNTFNSINFITRIYFDLDSNNFFIKMKDIMEMKTAFSDNYQVIINILCQLKNIVDENELLKWYINNEKELKNFEYIITKAREMSSKDIIKNLTPIVSKKEIVILDGQPFDFLVHKLSGYNNSYISKKINDDISKWNEYNAKDLVLSTSLINQFYLGMVSDDVPILGFNNLLYDDIIDIGIDDLYSNYSMYKKNAINSLSRYMLYEEFILNSVNPYNEIVIKRDHEGKSIIPNYLVSLDYITTKDKEISSYFNIPIYNVKTNIYINLMIDHLNYLFTTEQYKLYLIFFNKMCSSFVLNLNAISSYVNIDNLSKILDELLSRIDSNSNITKEEINTFKAIANTFNFVSNGQELIGNKFIKKLIKKIK